jgi:ribonuclease T2
VIRPLLLLLLLTLPAWTQGRNAPRGTAGQFDYYLLAMSWSPQYCSSPAGARDASQCGGRRYEFILHGLWPQYERGWPQFCATGERLSNALVERMQDITPSRRLVRNEWEKHGTCTGLSAAEYFGKARALFHGVKIPAPLRNPANARTVAPAKIRDEFAAANPGVPKEGITVQCAGRFLSEVRVCYTRDGKPRNCPADVQRQACRLPEIIVQPAR